MYSLYYGDHIDSTSLSVLYCSIDPVTGGPSKQNTSALDQMTPEEMEIEAEKLEILFRKLEGYVILRLYIQ